MVATEAGVIGRANARPITRRSVELPRTTGYQNPITSSSRQIFLKRVSLSLTSLKNTPERRVSLQKK